MDTASFKSEIMTVTARNNLLIEPSENAATLGRVYAMLRKWGREARQKGDAEAGDRARPVATDPEVQRG